MEETKHASKVSIICVTYDHAGFILPTIRSFFDQKVSFPVEIIVHDDASSDGTSEMIRELANKHPERIVAILQTENQRSKGIRPWPTCFARARGEYIALCEGDDHWIDPEKLQRQVEALDADPSASGCFTQAYNEQNGVRMAFHGDYTSIPPGPVLNEADYIRGQGIPTCTFVFRRSLLGDYDRIIYDFMTGDTALFTMLLGKGHFIYQPEYTAVRVMHPGGVYSMKGALHHVRVQLHNLPAQDALTGYKYRDLIQARMHSTLKYGWNEGLRHKNWELARLVWGYLRKDRSILGWSLYRTLVNGYMVHYPDGFQRLMRWKRRISGGNE